MAEAAVALRDPEIFIIYPHIIYKKALSHDGIFLNSIVTKKININRVKDMGSPTRPKGLCPPSRVSSNKIVCDIAAIEFISPA